MKITKYILAAFTLALGLASCMNDFDEPSFDKAPYGNNSIGEPNMTIAQFKEKYKTALHTESPTEITEDIILGGVVVSNDETGNVYKQLVFCDGSGNEGNEAMLLGINASGLYAYLPRGQRIALNLKGLSMGCYGNLPQIGVPYTNNKGNIAVGRMSEKVLKKHIKLVGEPSNDYAEMTPADLTESWMTSDNRETLPRYVRLKGVTFQEADGKKTFAPEEEMVSATNQVVNRTVKVGSKKIVFRMSTYADFANMVVPTGKLDITGILTCFNSDWQFMLSSDKDIVPAE